MKKIINFVIVLGILFLAFQFGVTLFKKSHSVDYELKINDRKITINEKYIKTKEDDYYLFKVNIGNNSFVFDTVNKFNKQKKVIDSFKIFEKDDLICISPVYIKNNDNADIVCNLYKQQTSYTKLKEEYNLDEFLNSLDNFDFDKYNSFDTISIIGKNNVYRDNFYDDEYLIVYDYKDLISITKKQNERINFSNYDVYHNETGVLIKEYYILPEFTGKPEYSGMLVINIKSGKQEVVEFEKAISTNIYINGVVDNKLYFFDKSNLVQYDLDPVKKTYRIVGNKYTNAQFYDGDWSTRNIYDFLTENVTFNHSYPLKDKYVEAFETSKYYYYYNSANEFYKVYKQELDNPILLFEYDEVKEVQVANDHIYFINDDTIYRYDDSGIKKIVTNNEFNYNYQNIYSVYFK